MPFFLGYTGLSDALMQKYIKDSEALWIEHMGDMPSENLPIATVGGTIGTHVGPGVLRLLFLRPVSRDKG